MGNALFIDLLETLKTINPYFIVIAEILIAYGTVIMLFRLFGKEGMFVYVTMAIILANIQILKLVPFPFISDPLPLGTVLFVSTYFATEIVNEHYGKKDAINLVALSFISYFLFMLLISISLAFQPLTIEALAEKGITDTAAYNWAFPIQEHLEAIFTPAPSFLIASLTAFAISQLANIFIFSTLIKKWQKKYLWLRGLISSCAGSFIDNTVFSLCAFFILAKEPLDIGLLISSYILAVFYFRVLLAFTETPMLYLSYKFKPISLQEDNKRKE